MNIESFRTYCLSLKATSESFPFDQHTLVFKVHNKVFAITGLDELEFKVNLKCDPEYALELRDIYPDSIMAGFHMNKKHWNTVNFENGLSDKLLFELVKHSYDRVVIGMTKKEKEIINQANERKK
jgi:predicted DNA-binding protein (MmcQ/YjbR family)